MTADSEKHPERDEEDDELTDECSDEENPTLVKRVEDLENRLDALTDFEDIQSDTDRLIKQVMDQLGVLSRRIAL